MAHPSVDLSQIRFLLEQFKHLYPGKVISAFKAGIYLPDELQILRRVYGPPKMSVVRIVVNQ
jgi:hypothetical protein